MFNARRAGVLLHPTSLPSPYGIGDFGPSARRFVGFLARAGQTFWQVLPLVPTDAVGSPYASDSAFAGNPLLISPEQLWRDGFLSDKPPGWSSDDAPVRYRQVELRKLRILKTAWRRFEAQGTARQRRALAHFRRRSAAWLSDDALYRALKEHFGQSVPWTRWPAAIRRRTPTAVRVWRRRLADRIRFHEFVQWQFDAQWLRIRRAAQRRGIRIIGDLPVYVTSDSLDTWRRPQHFHLDRRGRPTLVAGVPPDYFSRRGQVWGDPLYDWAQHRRERFAWWVARLRRSFELYDVVRLDHFRGYTAAWGVRAGSASARRGRWYPVPGRQLFTRVRRAFPGKEFIAEDLGIITPEVVALRNQLTFPGVRVLQFGFDDLGSIHYLKNLSRRAVAYTGTHDNNTIRGWFTDDALARERRHARQAVHFANLHRVAWTMIRVLYRSRANTVIVPLQDLLGLGSVARMNTPGRRTGNWRWRFPATALTPQLAERARQLARATRRA